jgi:hypothetical protein
MPGGDRLPAEVVAYLRNFIYRFGAAEKRAVEEFTRLLAG